MLDLSRLDCVKCTTGLEVELLAALVVERGRRRELERRLRMRLEQPRPIQVECIPPAIESPPPPKPSSSKATVNQIQAAVAARFGVTVNDLRSGRRYRKIALARQVAVWLCYALTPYSYPQIGRLFGNRDHTTMLHSVRNMDPRLACLLTERSTADSLDDWADCAFSKVSAATNGYESVV